MPQLDIASFFSQYVWLMVFYVGFYFILVNNFLPKLSRILKVRANKIINVNIATEKTETILNSRDSIERFKFAQLSLRQGFSNINNWIDSTAKNIKSKKTTNKFKALLTKEANLQARIHKDVKALLPLKHSAIVINKKQSGLLHKFHNKKTLSLFA